jgi:Flp pilus assembly protein TadB
MGKITPQDYVDAKVDLGRAGFLAIRTLLDESKEIPEVATTFGIAERTVEIVKTTTSYDEYRTIIDLELERSSLSTQLEKVVEKEQKLKPKTWHYVVAGCILLALVVGAIWLIVLGIQWLVGVF